jgi:hydrogenase-4 component E
MELHLSPMATSIFGLIITLIILLSFVMIGSRYVINHIISFTIQAWLLAATALMIGLTLKSIGFYILAGIYVVIRGILVPILFRRMLKLHILHREDAGNIKAGSSMLIGLVLVIFAVVIGMRLVSVMEITETVTLLAITSTFAVTLISFFMLILRNYALSKVIALLMIENAIVLGGQVLVLSSSIFVTLVVIFDLLLVIIGFHFLTKFMIEQIKDTDNRKMTRLIG